MATLPRMLSPPLLIVMSWMRWLCVPPAASGSAWIYAHVPHLLPAQTTPGVPDPAAPSAPTTPLAAMVEPKPLIAAGRSPFTSTIVLPSLAGLLAGGVKVVPLG